jgi:hypothetical protein
MIKSKEAPVEESKEPKKLKQIELKLYQKT